MVPILEGIIARRVLLNYRADPDVVRRLLPEPLEVVIRNGCAVVGVCLLRLNGLRAKGLPPSLGVSFEGMAHRVAIRYPTPDGMRDGVFIWRRETDRALVALLGGRCFPGVHRRAAFYLSEARNRLAIDVFTEGGRADVSSSAWGKTALFRDDVEASQFFERGDCGLSCGFHGDRLERIRLRTSNWEMTPLAVGRVRAAFYEARDRFPSGSVEFDCALLMRGIPHEWHPLSDVPGHGSVVAGKRR